MKFGLLYRVLAIIGIVVNVACFAVNLFGALMIFGVSIGFYHWMAMEYLFPVAVVLLVWMLVSGSSQLKSAFFGYVAIYVLSTAIALYFEGLGIPDALYMIVSLVLGGVCSVLPIMRFHDLCALLANRSTPQPANGAAAGREQAAPAGRSGAKFSMPKRKKKSAEQKSKRRTGLDFEPAGPADAATATQPTAGAPGASGRISSQQAAPAQPAAAQTASSQGAYQQPAPQQTASTRQASAPAGQAVPQAGYQQARSQQELTAQQQVGSQQTARSASAASWSGTSQQTASQQAAASHGAARTASAQAGASSQGSSGKVAVNSCPRDAFLALPGFSIAQASRAVSEREQNGPYRSVDDFVARNNVKPHFAVQMEGLISVETATKASAAATRRPRGRGLDL